MPCIRRSKTQRHPRWLTDPIRPLSPSLDYALRDPEPDEPPADELLTPPSDWDEEPWP